MSEKTSQKTEEEMLDQTFGNYAEDTVMDTQSPPESSASSVKKKSNSTMIIGAGVGIAALVLIGSKFLGGSSEQPVEQPPTPIAETPVAQEPALKVPEEAQVLDPVTVADPISPPVLPEANIMPVNPNELAGALPTATPDATMPIPVEPAPVMPVEPTSVAPVVPAQPPVVEAVVLMPMEKPVDVLANPNVVASNNQQMTVTDDLKMMFDKQSQELKSALDGVGNRVSTVEQHVVEQKKVNQSVEERLTRLETGKSTINYTEPAKSPKKPSIKKKVAKKVLPKKVEANHMSTDVLIDKSNSKSVVVETTRTIVEQKLPVVEIHSVYSGRIWTKNNDGSLSTFVAGDRLPNGELIKKVDDEKFEITTDKRVIGK